MFHPHSIAKSSRKILPLHSALVKHYSKYGIQFWRPANKSDLTALEKTQRQPIKTDQGAACMQDSGSIRSMCSCSRRFPLEVYHFKYPLPLRYRTAIWSFLHLPPAGPDTIFLPLQFPVICCHIHFKRSRKLKFSFQIVITLVCILQKLVAIPCILVLKVY